METLEELQSDLINLMDVHNPRMILETIKNSFEAGEQIYTIAEQWDRADELAAIADCLEDILNELYDE